MTINLRIKFKDIKKRVVLPIFSYEKGGFIVIMPLYENGKLIDIVRLNLPIQTLQKPTMELYRFLRMRGVI